DVASLVEIQLKLGRAMARFYRRLAEALVSPDPLEDVFEPQHRPSAAQRAKVAEGARHLCRDRSFPEPLVGRLAHLLPHAPDKRLERVRAYALADAWRERREEVLDLLLHAADVGLVVISWDMICPECRTAHEACATLQRVARAGTCTTCGAGYERDLSCS